MILYFLLGGELNLSIYEEIRYGIDANSIKELNMYTI
jgi:hypothetical protein